MSFIIVIVANIFYLIFYPDAMRDMYTLRDKKGALIIYGFYLWGVMWLVLFLTGKAAF